MDYETYSHHPHNDIDNYVSKDAMYVELPMLGQLGIVKVTSEYFAFSHN